MHQVIEDLQGEQTPDNDDDVPVSDTEDTEGP